MRRLANILIPAVLFVALPAFAADWVAVDEAEFAKVLAKDAKAEKLAGDMKFTEGPTWVKSLNAVIFSDIPANELKSWSAKDGLKTFRTPSNNSNGTALDAEGRLLCAEHGSRSITRTEKDGTVKTLASAYNGKKLNSPNDLVVKSDGTIYFTDPDYGVPKDQKKEQEKNNVYRLDPKTGDVKVLVDDFVKPNGICFSPDEKKCYIADSGTPKHIRVFEVAADGTLTNGKVFCVLDKGAPDGIRCDTDGRVWSSSGDGAQVFNPDGKLIGRITLPESGANLCFGGEDGKTLFVTARKSLYAIKTLVSGK